MYRSNVYNNTQHGAYIENSRNYVFINESKLTHNGYGAGVRVYGGAADVHVNASNVDYNTDNGVNITHDGGWRIFNMSSFSHNLVGLWLCKKRSIVCQNLSFRVLLNICQ